MINDSPIKYVKYQSFAQDSELENGCVHLLYHITGAFVLESNLTQARYEAGDVCYISSSSRFVLHPLERCELIHMAVDEKFIEECCGSYRFIMCDSVREPNNDYSQVRAIIAEIASMYADSVEKHYLKIMSLLYKLMDILKESFSAEGIENIHVSDKYAKRIKEIMSYIEDNYAAQITLQSIAEQLYLTPQYVSSFFKNQMHCNFREYLLEKRIFHASRDLRYTDDAIGSIAVRNGFSSAAVFSRAFSDKMGCSPNRYRLKNSRTNEDDGITSSLGSGVVSDENEVNIAVNMRKEKGFFINSKIVNVGAVQNLTHESFIKSLMESRNELKYEYVRIQGVISSSFIPKVLPKYTFYFSMFDSVFGRLYQMDCIPWIELFNTESLSPDNLFFGDQNSGRHLYGKRFYEMFEAIIAHAVRVFPKSWMEKWVFEAYKNEYVSPLQYAENVLHIRKILEKYIPGARLGGFGLVLNKDISLVDEVFDSMDEIGSRVDFFSIYGNIVTNEKDGPVLPAVNPNILTDRVKKIRELLQERNISIPLCMTEWNSFTTPNMPLQQTCYQATFICRTMLGISDLIDVSGYLYFKESPADTMRMDNPSPNHYWGYGLIDRNNLKSPAYYSFCILNELGTSSVDAGENYIVTKDDDGSYQVLLYGYSHVDTAKYINLNDDTSFTEIYSIFRDYERRNVRFELTGLEKGTYRIERMVLNRLSGSVLDLWIGGFNSSIMSESDYLSRIQPPLPHQVNYYSKACMPEYRTIYCEVKESLEIKYSLGAHEMCLWRITKLY
ncbi:MAG: helix-turn-helix domain-containing protein [Lachnospiraceae bacterium]|nr:helix-turn-helix domain-containing protein [Lachnospiraceae bacterium]